MKLNKFLLSAIAAASLTACSDSTDVVKNDKGQWNADGTGYVSLSISMPDNVASKGTRAAGDADGSHNDKFNDGDLNEYAVYNAMLVIFTSNTDDDEGNYKLAAAYSLPLTFKSNGPAHDQISSISTATTKISSIGATYAKALVILNKPASITLDEENHTIKLNNGTTTDDLKDITFSEFQNKTTAVATELVASAGFTMTNAPLTTYHSTTTGVLPASDGKTTTLADITTGNIKRTAAEAEATPAATIYVERSVAKVTLSNTDAGTLASDATIHYKVEGFALDNTNKTSYIVRNADKTTTEWYKLKSKSSDVNSFADQYRFVGSTAVAGDLYRTYWAEDPNYSSDGDGAKAGISTTPTAFKGTSEALYCMENTFDVANQRVENTTRAILKVCFWKNEASKPETVPTLFMYNNDVKTLNDKTAFLTAAKNEVNNIPAVLAHNNGVESITLTDEATSDYVEVESVKYNDGTTEASGDIFNMIKNHFGKIAVYKDGIAYYPVLIKHFGDQLTPWNIEGAGKEWTVQPSVGGVDKIYPDGDGNRNANYLGRYGVVRNNWYDLKINSVKRPGKPAIDNATDTPDDELESYISVSINILSWAKRQQSVDLQ